MQAVILASGINSRVKHLFPDLPKAMFPLGGKPYLEHFLSLRFAEGFDDIIIVVYYQAVAIENFINNLPMAWREKIRVIKRKEGYGPVGVLTEITNILNDQFFLFYCDVLYKLENIAKIAKEAETYPVTTLITQDKLGMFEKMEIVIDEKTNLVKSFAPGTYDRDQGWMDVGQLNSKSIINQLKKYPPEEEHLNKNIWPALLAERHLAYHKIGPVFDIGTEKNFELSSSLYDQYGLGALDS